MQIKSTELKSLVKRLAGVNAANLSLDLTAGSIAATDIDITAVVMSTSLRGDPHASCSVPAKQFTSIVSRTSGEVTITQESDFLVIKTAKARFELPASHQKQFPVPTPTKTWTVPLKATREILQFAATASTGRRGLGFDYQSVVQLSPRGPESEYGITIRAVGTDGQRMAVGDAFVSIPRTDFRLLVPTVAIRTLAAFDGVDMVIGESDKTIHFGFGDADSSTTIVARKQAKEFPDFEKAIPVGFAFRGTVKADEFREALRNIEPVINDENRVTSLRFNGKLTLSGGKDLGTAIDEIDFTQIEPDPVFDDADFRVKLNHAFLSDFAGSVTGNITFGGNGPQDPVWLEAEGRKLLAAAIR